MRNRCEGRARAMWPYCACGNRATMDSGCPQSHGARFHALPSRVRSHPRSRFPAGVVLASWASGRHVCVCERERDGCGLPSPRQRSPMRLALRPSRPGFARHRRRLVLRQEPWGEVAMGDPHDDELLLHISRHRLPRGVRIHRAEQYLRMRVRVFERRGLRAQQHRLGLRRSRRTHVQVVRSIRLQGMRQFVHVQA